MSVQKYIEQAEQGVKGAALLLGRIYRDGSGIDINIPLAREYFTMAEKRKERGAREELDKLDNKINELWRAQRAESETTLKKRIETLEAELVTRAKHYEEKITSLENTIKHNERIEIKREVSRLNAEQKIIRENKQLASAYLEGRDKSKRTEELLACQESKLKKLEDLLAEKGQIIRRIQERSKEENDTIRANAEKETGALRKEIRRMQGMLSDLQIENTELLKTLVEKNKQAMNWDALRDANSPWKTCTKAGIHIHYMVNYNEERERVLSLKAANSAMIQEFSEGLQIAFKHVAVPWDQVRIITMPGHNGAHKYLQNAVDKALQNLEQEIKRGIATCRREFLIASPHIPTHSYSDGGGWHQKKNSIRLESGVSFEGTKLIIVIDDQATAGRSIELCQELLQKGGYGGAIEPITFGAS
jgi:DNA repair exonuclease SbcCD ATPase subunit